MMPSRGVAAARGCVPRFAQSHTRRTIASHRSLSTTPRISPRIPHIKRRSIASSISSPWRTYVPILGSTRIAIRYASTTPASTPSASIPSESPTASAATTEFPNLDTINIDDMGLNTLADLAKIPEKVGYLHEIGINYGWGPTSSIQWLLENIHIYGDLPWWSSIAATAIVLRLITFPFYLKAADSNARQAALVSVTKPITTRMTELQKEGNTQGVMMAYNQLKAVRARAGLSFRDQFAPLILQGVLGYCGFKLIRGMVSLPVPGLLDGGFLWLSDLTASDPYLILPTLMAASVAMLVRLGGETGSMNTELVSPQMRFTMNYLMPGLIFLIMGWQSGALCVWFASSGLIGISQALLLRNPTVREKLGIAPIYKPGKDEAGPSSLQALMAGLRPSAPTPQKAGTGSASTASGAVGKSATFMKPSYQAPNLQRKASSMGSQAKIIDVKGTSTPSSDEMVTPSPKKNAFVEGVEGAVTGFKETWTGMRQTGTQHIKASQEARLQKAKKRQADDYERRARLRGGR